MSNIKVVLRKHELIIYNETTKDFECVNESQHNYIDILNYLLNNGENIDENYLFDLIEHPNKDVKKYSPSLKEEKRKISIENIELPQSLVDKIRDLKNNGFSYKYLENFWDNCKRNPNPQSISRLFDFLSKENLVISDDGCFFAYKGVREDYKDIHTGTFDNSPGCICEMPRENVEYDPDKACASGLHVGTHEYAKWFSQNVVMVKINPKDVVSVPYDHDCHKLRTCRYEVVKSFVEKEKEETQVLCENCEKEQYEKEKHEELKIRSNIKWEEWEDKNLRKLKKLKINWNDIGEKMNRTSESCRKRWRKINK